MTTLNASNITEFINNLTFTLKELKTTADKRSYADYSYTRAECLLTDPHNNNYKAYLQFRADGYLDIWIETGQGQKNISKSPRLYKSSALERRAWLKTNGQDIIKKILLDYYLKPEYYACTSNFNEINIFKNGYKIHRLKASINIVKTTADNLIYWSLELDNRYTGKELERQEFSEDHQQLEHKISMNSEAFNDLSKHFTIRLVDGLIETPADQFMAIINQLQEDCGIKDVVNAWEANYFANKL